MKNNNAMMSVFKSLQSKSPFTEITMDEFLSEIQNGKYKDEIDVYRNLLDQEIEEAKKFKREKIPFVTYTGLNSDRTDAGLKLLSAFIILDIDDCNDVHSVKQLLSTDKHVYASFISPSRNGLKVVMKMNFGNDASVYKARYTCVMQYFSKTYNLPILKGGGGFGIDSSCANISRGCLFSHDENLYVNYDAEIFNEFTSLSDTERKIQEIVSAVSEKKIDITASYQNWFSVGCALYHCLGEDGRYYFHELSKFHFEYEIGNCDKQFDLIAKSDKGGITIATLFQIAKDNDLMLTSSKPKKLLDYTVNEIDEQPFLIPLVPFPIEVFPTEVKEFILEAQKSLCSSVDMIASCVLTVISVCIGNTRVIAATKDWEEPAVIYISIVAEPGAKKTPTLSLTTLPIKIIQSSYFAQYNDELKRFQELMAEYQTLLAKYHKENKKGEKPTPPAKPTLKQLKVDDATMEALSEILHINPRGVICIHDELAILVNSMNQYRGGKGGDSEKWLSFWSCFGIIINRKDKTTIQIEHPFVSVLGGIQPDVLKSFSGKKRNGFIDRFLFAYPDVKLVIPSGFSIDEEVKLKYERIIMRIANWELKYDDEKRISPLKMNLSEGAKICWQEWLKQHYEEMNHYKFPYFMRGVWSKLEAYTLRFALILNSVKSHNRFSSRIEIDDMEGAIKLTTYFKGQAYKVHTLIHSSPIDKKVIEAVEFLKKKKGNATMREFYNQHVGGCRNNGEAQKLFSELVNRGLGEIYETKPSRGGRTSFVFKLSDTENINEN